MPPIKTLRDPGPQRALPAWLQPAARSLSSARQGRPALQSLLRRPCPGPWGGGARCEPRLPGYHDPQAHHRRRRPRGAGEERGVAGLGVVGTSPGEARGPASR